MDDVDLYEFENKMDLRIDLMEWEHRTAKD